MNWYIGQEIVCVKQPSRNYIKKGSVYTICSLRENPCKLCGGIIMELLGTNVTNHSECHNEKLVGAWYGEEFFAPLDAIADISELTEILQTTKPFEV